MQSSRGENEHVNEGGKGKPKEIKAGYGERF